MAGTIDYDKLVLAAAGKRNGICFREELLEQGMSRSAVDRRVRAGLLTAVGRGVYLVPELTDARTPLQRALALVPLAILSHLTAAVLRVFPVDRRSDQGGIHVTTAHHVGRRADGIVIHALRRRLAPEDVGVVDDLPVTSPARTVFDLAALLTRPRLRYTVQTLIRDGSLEPGQLIACFDANARRGVNGVSTLRPVLASMFDPADIERSALEEALARLLAANEINGFQQQYRPPWFDGIQGTVDFAHPSLRIVLEADGRRWHRRDQEMAGDRKRDRLAAAHGWVTLRVTWYEVVERPASTAADIKAVVHRRGAEQRTAA